MVMNCLNTFSKRLLLGILIVVLCGVYHAPLMAAEAGGFKLSHLTIESDPADGDSYRGDREIDPTSNPVNRIVNERWTPRKVPPLITYTASAYAEGPGTLTLYFGTASESQPVGSWDGNGPLSDGDGNYESYVREKNEDNYDFPASFRPPYDDPCTPWLNKGYKQEITENTSCTLSRDGVRATFNAIDTHAGGANTSKRRLMASAGWKEGSVSIDYETSETQSWIHRPSATSLAVPETSLSLSGSFSVSLNDINTSGSQQTNPPHNCVLCPARENGCNNYVSSVNEHQLTCPHHGIYYSCNEDDYNLHKPRNCNFNRWPFSDEDPCGQPFRNCMPGHCPYGVVRTLTLTAQSRRQ